MSDPKLLPRTTDVASQAREVVVVDRYPGATISYERRDLYTSHHESISEGVMMVGMHNANAVVQVANSQFAVPAVEKTKQVRTIGFVVVAVALAAILGVVVKPEAGASIVGIAGIVTGVFGGLFVADHLLKKSAPTPPPSS